MKSIRVWAAVMMVCGGCVQNVERSMSNAQCSRDVREVIAAKEDVWGERALARPEGPTYGYFEKLLPPLRYVDAPGFRCYPIVMSAPGAKVKGRLVSDGGEFNALARQPIWKNEEGMPVRVVVGEKREQFGEDLGRLEGPKLAEGWMPIVGMRYHARNEEGEHRTSNTQHPTSKEGEEAYGEEVFASVEEGMAADGAMLVRFTFPNEDAGRVELQIEGGYQEMRMDRGQVLDAKGRVVVGFDGNWDWVPARNQLISKVKHGKTATAVIYTRPAKRGVAMSEAVYDTQRKEAVKRWREAIGEGMRVQVPEDYVNRAWRGTVCGTFGIMTGQMNYSAGNQYARQYAHESGQAIQAMVEWGYGREMRGMYKPLFAYHRPGIELHDAGFLLRDLADYYFATGDWELVEDLRPMWRAEVARIMKGRKEGIGGLLPREKYCSDIETPVVSLNTNANCWRGLRDMAAVLEDVGEVEESAKLQQEADDFRQAILKAEAKAWDRSVTPAFLPLALGEESAHDPITETRLGSYWNLVINSLIGSGILRYDSPEMGGLLKYIQTRGGLCMGMTRVQSARAGWGNVQNIDDLYGGRYALELLERDEADRALVSFYGKLAQGMTRDAFVDGEATSIEPFDRYGRMMGLPPNSAANGSFLLQLRNLLVQDWDLDEDGKAETLRLLFATPRGWMEEGKRIRVEGAPTAFGKVSVVEESHLSKGYVEAKIEMPERTLKRALVRFRVPRGWSVTGAEIDGQGVTTAEMETFDLTGRMGTVVIRARVKKVPE